MKKTLKVLAIILIFFLVAFAGFTLRQLFLIPSATQSILDQSQSQNKASEKLNNLASSSKASYPLVQKITDPKPQEQNTINSFNQGMDQNSFTTSIQIQGEKDCIDKTNKALATLKQMAPEHFKNVEKYIGIISCAASNSGMYAWENPPRFQVGQAIYSSETKYYASAIVHDAYHSKLYHDYVNKHNLDGRPPADVWTGEEAEQKCLQAQYDSLVQMQAEKRLLDYVKNIADTKYWQENLQDRWW